ncbi:MAG: hypothetical protein LBT20_07290, partial [Clostridiales bacterium]|nr:hypothetical protein [Clostridiales bacterium]
MKPLKLEFFGLYNFSETQTVDFGGFAPSESIWLLGEHDKGVGVIAELLVYALFGETEKGGAERYIVNRKVKNSGIKLGFTHDGQEYEIERTFAIGENKKRALSEAVLYNVRDGVKYLAADGVNAAGAAVSKLLGIGAETFKKALLINAYNAVGLLSLTDDAQLKYFKNILEISEFDGVFKTGVQRRITDLKIKRTALTSYDDPKLLDGGREKLLLEYASKKVGETAKIAELKVQKNAAAQKLERIDRLVVLKERLVKIDSELDVLDLQREEYEALDKTLKISAQAGNILPAYKRREELIRENEELSLKQTELLSDIAVIEAEAEAAKLEKELAEAEFDKLYAAYSEKRDVFKKSLDENSDLDIRRQLEESLRKDREDLDGVAGKKVDLLKRLDEVRAECEELEKKIEELTVDPEFSFDISRANSYEATL